MRGGGSRRNTTAAPRKELGSNDLERTDHIPAPPRKSKQQTSEFTTWPKNGFCTAMICGDEAGCVPHQNGTYSCVCPHVSSFPDINLKCRRKLVPLDPRPIPNILVKNSTTRNVTTTQKPEISTVSASNLMSSATALIVGAASLAGMFLLLVLLLLCCKGRLRKSLCMSLKDKKRKPEQNATPVSLSKGLLDADRYTTNPQYFVAAPDSAGPLPLSVPTIPREKITFLQVIGEGCFGKVFKGELYSEINDKETVAIKVLKDSATKEAEDDFMREVEIMSSFQHSNILSLLGVALKEPGKSPWMVFEFMHHGDLTEVLRSNANQFWKSDLKVPKLTKESLLSIAYQIACGMEYLAGQHFVHRDLACRNCLVGFNLKVKIADFGMSRDVYTCDYYKIGGSRLLPVRWMSPESVTYGRFTLESDVWSYGVVLWEIYSLGKQPYYGHSNEEVVKLILQGIMLIPPEDCPPAICDLMQCCWKTEPRDRATFAEIRKRLLRINISAPLPRPPAFPVGLNSQQVAVDSEDYLKPAPSRPPHEYLQPLPD